MRKRKDIFHKRYFYIACIVVILLLAGLLLFDKPKNLSVTVFTKPYNISSECDSEDLLEINILINQTNTYFTSYDKIDKSYLTDSEGNIIKLDINDIHLEDNQYDIYDNTYFNYTYIFKIDFPAISEYELYMEKAILVLIYSNSLSSKINIGSFSYYKYPTIPLKLSVNYLKAVTDSNNGVGLWGIKIGLRNLTAVNVTLKEFKLLDGTVEVGEVRKGNNQTITNINSCIPSYPVCDNQRVLYYELENNDPCYFTIGINYLNNKFILPLNCFGIRVKYLYLENEYYYYITPFIFYKTTYFRIPFEELEMLTYEYK